MKKIDPIHLIRECFFSKENIEKIEKHYNAKYLIETCVKTVDGQWTNFPVNIFWTDTPHPEGSNYFGMYYNLDNHLMICDGKSAVDGYINAYITPTGEVRWSHYRHDYRYVDNDLAIDGGRDYCRIIGSLSSSRPVKLKISGDAVYEMEPEDFEKEPEDELC